MRVAQTILLDGTRPVHVIGSSGTACLFFKHPSVSGLEVPIDENGHCQIPGGHFCESPDGRYQAWSVGKTVTLRDNTTNQKWSIMPHHSPCEDLPPINFTESIDLADMFGSAHDGSGVWTATIILTNEYMLLECVGKGCDEHNVPRRRLMVMRLSDREWMHTPCAVSGMRLRSDGHIVAGGKNGLTIVNFESGEATTQPWQSGETETYGLHIIAIGPNDTVLAQHMRYNDTDLVLFDASGAVIRRWRFNLEGLTDVYCAMVTNDYFVFEKSGRIFAVQRKGQKTCTLRVGEANLHECVGPDQGGIARPFPKHYTARVHAIRIENDELVIGITKARDPNAYSLTYGEVEEIKWRPFA